MPPSITQAALVGALAVSALLAQTPAQLGSTGAATSAADAPKKFEVSTVKPNLDKDFRVSIGMQPGGRFVGTGVPLRMLIGTAYDVRDFQISGGPGWLATDRWDINAKAEGVSGRLPPEQFGPMLKALLEDRFQLKTHMETKEMSIYALVPGKNGAKLKPNSGQPGPMMRMGRGELTATKVPMNMLTRMLSQQLGRTMVDKTGLTGEYDFKLEFLPEIGQGGFGGLNPPPPGAFGPDGPGAVDPGRPALTTAVQEQLGLRLDSQKGPVEMLVIDHAEKPTEN
jgi:bla regulator protein blaR1